MHAAAAAAAGGGGRRRLRASHPAVIRVWDEMRQQVAGGWCVVEAGHSRGPKVD